jgi:putative cardiolipin synthase
MHNKQMIADNRVAIIGGRNIGDEYFGLNPDFNFHDLDVLGVGPVARQASAVFDRYWNSDWVRRMPKPTAGRGRPTLIGCWSAAAWRCWPTPPAGAILPGGSWDGRTGRPGRRRCIGRSTVHTDSPSRAAGAATTCPSLPRPDALGAREVLITNAYIIPDATSWTTCATLARAA